MQCCAAVRVALWHEIYHKVPVENNKYPNFEWKKEGRGVNCFVLSRENSSLKLPTGTLLNNFVTDCSSNTSVWDILDCLESKMIFVSLLLWVDMSKKQRVGYYEQNNVRDKWVLTNSLLPSRPQPLFQSGAKCKVIDMKIFFILMQIKLIFTRKLGFALFLNWYSVWLPSSYCHTEMAWNTISGWLQGFCFKK